MRSAHEASLVSARPPPPGHTGCLLGAGLADMKIQRGQFVVHARADGAVGRETCFDQALLMSVDLQI